MVRNALTDVSIEKLVMKIGEKQSDVVLTRRKFFGAGVGLAGLAAVIKPAGSTEGAAEAAKTVIFLENSRLRAEFSSVSGALIGLTDKSTGWNLLREGGPTFAFSLHVPLPDRRAHFLTETGNPLAAAEKSTDGQTVTFRWARLSSPETGPLAIDLAATATLDATGLCFELTIRNGSPYVIESAGYPIFSDLVMPAGSKKLSYVKLDYAHGSVTELAPHFKGGAGYWGVNFPSFVDNPGDNFFSLIQADNAGLYVGYHDITRNGVPQFWAELRPGYGDSFDEAVASGGEDPPARILFKLNRLHFIQPGTEDRGPTIRLEPYRGDWSAGIGIYKRWRATWFKRTPAPDWVKSVHSWQQIQINSSEDRLLFPYEKLVKYAETCARYGVKAIQLTGWNVGGQDRDTPNHDTDPRLGTTEDLKRAIAGSRALGVEIVLFNKYTWDEITSPFYERFSRFVVLDQFGNPYRGSSYAYDTPTQLAAINRRTFDVMCTASPGWRELAAFEMQKSVDLGASGILFDECQHHGGALFCFAKDHGHTVPAPIFSGDMPLIELFRSKVDQTSFLFSGEAPYDLETQGWSLSYTRIVKGHIPMQRLIDPELPIMVAVTGFNDREMINRALLYRYVFSYEPFNFKGSLDAFPKTMAYGGKVDALRRRYASHLWESEYRHQAGAAVQGPGGTHPDWSVFVHPRTGKRAVVALNGAPEGSVRIRIALDGPTGPLSYVTPEAPNAVPFDGFAVLPPASALAVLEG